MALVFNVILMFVMAGALCIANYSFVERNRDKDIYIFEDAPDSGTIAGAAFFSFYLILNSFMPLELPVIIEISKFLATLWMQSDAAMCHVNKQYGDIDKLRVNNMNLHEELANISYVFCDKTGTLTQNELNFQKMTIVKDTNKGTLLIEAPEGDSSKMLEQLNIYQHDANLDRFYKCVTLCHDCIVLDLDNLDERDDQKDK